MTLFNGKNGAIAASVINIFSGGVPLLYTGQEVGKTGTTPFFNNSNINWTANADMLAAYQKIYEIYNSEAAARGNSISAYQLSNDLICWKKTSGSQSVLVLVNVRNNTINISLPPVLTGDFTNLNSGQSETLSTNLSLTPYAYRIYKMN
jgi:glycosidase